MTEKLEKVIALIIGLAIVAAAVFGLLQASRHPKTDEARNTFRDKSDILLGNLADSVSPLRKPPLTTIELEENLKSNLPVPFARFGQEDWDWFWNLLYARFTDDSGGWPKRKKQLTKYEIQSTLADSYQPFDRFTERQWNIFWQYILKGRVFKR